MRLTRSSLLPSAAHWRRMLLGKTERRGALTVQPLPIVRICGHALGVWLATRLVLLLICVLARVFGFVPLVPTAQGVFSATPQYAPLVLPQLATHPVLATWVHWDASWYVFIALHGYDIAPATTSNWFPLYPLVLHLATLLLGRDAVVVVALLLSNLTALAAFVGLGLLAAHDEAAHDEAHGADGAEDAARRLIKVTAAYPFAFFLFAPYSESCFLACLAFCFLCARRGRWCGAAVWAFLAGLTRPTAVALVPALAWEFGRQHEVWVWVWRSWRSWRSWHATGRRLRTLSTGLAVVAAMPLGLGCYLLFVWRRYGDALLPIRAQYRSHGHVSWPVYQTLAELVRRFVAALTTGTPWASGTPEMTGTPSAALLYLDGGVLLLFLLITLLNVRRLPLFYTLYMLATCCLLLETPVPHRPELLVSAGRYMLVSVPVFLVLARWMRGRPALEMVLVDGGFMLQALFTLFFLTGSTWIE